MKATMAVFALAGALAFGTGAALAQYSGVGAPTSAAGGVAPPPSVSSPGAVGPLGGTSGSVMGSSGSSLGSSSSSIRDLSRGTGKFNNTRDPCLGRTGFGPTKGTPGYHC
ncbi:MAG TPA: hypothetical protein VMW18_10020 [Candidatus Binatia bacterium]|nr:hypothetical protein [Candidatus Binatia bacterium]